MATTEVATSAGDGPLKCIQVTLPETQGCPSIHAQVIFLYPSSSIMLWFSIAGSGRIGSTSMAIPMPSHIPATSTRLDGYSASDTTDRLAKLLCRKYARQVFVSASLPRAQMQMISTADGNGEEVVIKKVMTEFHRVIKEEQTLLDTGAAAASNGRTGETSLAADTRSRIGIDNEALNGSLDELIINN